MRFIVTYIIICVIVLYLDLWESSVISVSYIRSNIWQNWFTNMNDLPLIVFLHFYISWRIYFSLEKQESYCHVKYHGRLILWIGGLKYPIYEVYRQKDKILAPSLKIFWHKVKYWNDIKYHCRLCMICSGMKF